MKTILVEISFGELLDKISILEIKKEKIIDTKKLEIINHELKLLKLQFDNFSKANTDKSNDELNKLYLFEYLAGSGVVPLDLWILCK